MMNFIGHICLALFFATHIVIYKSLQMWVLKPHPQFPQDYPLPSWVHLVVAIPSAALAVFITWIIINI